jgi:hypothetical protein
VRGVLPALLASTLGVPLLAMADGNGFATPEEFDQFVSHYYQKPEPERVIPSLRYVAQELGLTAGEASERSGLVAFYGAIFRQDERPAASAFQDLSALAERSPEFLWQVLWFAGTPGTRSLLDSLGPPPKSPRRAQWEELRKAVPPDPLTMEIADPGVIDVFWGSFFATGDERFVLRVIGALPLTRSEHDAQKIRIAASAETSLVSNARRHEKVLGICKARLGKEPKAVRKALEQVIARAVAP